MLRGARRSCRSSSGSVSGRSSSSRRSRALRRRGGRLPPSPESRGRRRRPPRRAAGDAPGVPTSEGRVEPPPGLLRVLVLFHEAERLGAGLSVLRVLPELEAYGWTASGWFPGDGELVSRARERLAA